MKLKVRNFIIILSAFISVNSYGGYPYDFDIKPDWGKLHIAVVDTVFDTKHHLLKNNIVKQWNVQDQNCDVEPTYQDKLNAIHGTHVAGIITQNLPNSKIILIATAEDSRQEELVDSLKHLASEDHVKLINFCRGREYMPQEFMDNIKLLASQGKMIILSAGNDYKMLDSFNWGRSLSELLKDPIVRNHLIVVGATEDFVNSEDESKKITQKRKADYSNYPNDNILKENFICAEGEAESGIPYRYGRKGMAKYSGTSQATPLITACIAELMQEYNISSTKAWKVIKKTAVKKHDAFFNVDNTGQGILDIREARNYMENKRNKFYGRQNHKTVVQIDIGSDLNNEYDELSFLFSKPKLGFTYDENLKVLKKLENYFSKDHQNSLNILFQEQNYCMKHSSDNSSSAVEKIASVKRQIQWDYSDADYNLDRTLDKARENKLQERDLFDLYKRFKISKDGKDSKIEELRRDQGLFNRLGL